MKRIKFTLTMMATFIVMNSYTQVVVSLHHIGGVQHFSGVNALLNAYTASSSGDTIYLPGGSFTPPTNFDKGIAIYGAGHYTDSTMATGKTFFFGSVTLNGNADNFYLEGVEVTGSFTFANNASVNGVTIKYCKIDLTFSVPGDQTTPSNNLALINDVFVNDVILTNAAFSVVYNSIVQGHISSSVGNSIYNNICLYIGGSSDPVLSIPFVNNNVYNNIFLQTLSNSITGGSGNTFKNNLFILSAPDYGSTPVAQNNYVGIVQSSIFTTQSGNIFNYTHNYHLQLPGTYLGADGSQVGIYGGIFPYKEGAVPSNPHIRVRTISPTTNSDGKLTVNITVAAQNN